MKCRIYQKLSFGVPDLTHWLGILFKAALVLNSTNLHTLLHYSTRAHNDVCIVYLDARSMHSMGSGSGSDLHRRKTKRRHSLFFLSFQSKEFHYYVYVTTKVIVA